MRLLGKVSGGQGIRKISCATLQYFILLISFMINDRFDVPRPFAALLCAVVR